MMTGFEPGTFGIGSGYYKTEPQPLPQSAVILPHLFAMIKTGATLKIKFTQDSGFELSDWLVVKFELPIRMLKNRIIFCSKLLWDRFLLYVYGHKKWLFMTKYKNCVHGFCALALTLRKGPITISNLML